MNTKCFHGFAVFSIVLAASACGGGGGGGTGGGGGGAFPSGIYVMQNSIQDITGMSDMTGANWARYDNIGRGAGITFDGQGRLYVINHLTNRLTRYSGPSDAIGVGFGSTGSGANQFNNPTSVAIDAQGRIYIADGGNRRLVRMDDMSGTNWTVLSLIPWISSLEPQIDLDFDSQGRILMVSRIDRRVVRVDDMGGVNAVVWLDPGSGVAELDVPSDICVDSQDRIYICDTGNNRIVRMNEGGFGWVSLGTLGDGALQFDKPVGISLDAQGRIYTYDVNNSRVVRVNDITGAGWTTFGASGSTGVGEFSSSSDIVVK